MDGYTPQRKMLLIKNNIIFKNERGLFQPIIIKVAIIYNRWGTLKYSSKESLFIDRISIYIYMFKALKHTYKCNTNSIQRVNKVT